VLYGADESEGVTMKTLLTVVSGLVMGLGLLAQPLFAQGNGQRMQAGAAGGQNGGKQAADTAQQAGQMAQFMLMNFDQNGDGALNLLELRAALDAMLQRMHMNEQASDVAKAAAGANGQNMIQAQRGQNANQTDASSDGRTIHAQGGRRGGGGGGGGKGGQGR
jgi:hypothetical protein